VRILILGGTGLLGSFLNHYFLKKRKKVFSTGYKKKNKYYLNLFNQNNILKFFNLIKPNIIINCAAQTNVEKCINDFNFGYKGNALIVKNVVSAIKKLKYKPHFIHFSTDQVYNNNTKKRKSSEHQVSLTNNYSVTKYLGELEAKKNLKSTIIRCNFFGKSFLKKRKTFSDYIIYNLSKKNKIKIPNNIFYNPVSLNYIAKILELIIFKKKTGIYNLGSKDNLSKFNFGILIQKKYSLPSNLIIAYKSNYNKDRRPLNTSVSTRKIEKSLRIKAPFIKDMIVNNS
jgi:dTDP-4-dehydrorhamnose reductase